jgi:hypothetical protein
MNDDDNDDEDDDVDGSGDDNESNIVTLIFLNDSTWECLVSTCRNKKD